MPSLSRRIGAEDGMRGPEGIGALALRARASARRRAVLACCALAPLDIGVDEAALDRAGAEERRLHDQVVEASAAASARADAIGRATRSGRRPASARRGSSRMVAASGGSVGR